MVFLLQDQELYAFSLSCSSNILMKSCGLDVHKNTVVACVMITPAPGKANPPILSLCKQLKVLYTIL